MDIIYARQPLPSPEKLAASCSHSIFLAGPTPRVQHVPSWRPEAIEKLEKAGFDGSVFIPEDSAANYRDNYDDQIQWEWDALTLADTIMFWVPRCLDTMPAFTTNVEFGLYVNSGKVVLGYPEKAPKMRYLHALATRYDTPVAHTLDDTLALILNRVEAKVPKTG